MKISSMPLQQFKEFIRGRKIACFGAGIQGQRVGEILCDWGLGGHIVAYIDNDDKKSGTKIKCLENTYPIVSFAEACRSFDASLFLLITSLNYKEIYKQLEENEASRRWDTLAIDEVAEEQFYESGYDHIVRESDTPMIPKIIHYAWLGDPMPENLKANIENWKSLCPDYEFHEWNEKNYDVSSNLYMKQAYELKNWEYVTDYMRLDIAYQYGGIYLDTDIEMLKNPDPLLYQKCFGCTDATMVMNLGSGFGAMPGNSIIGELRDYYDDVPFVRKDGSIDKRSCNSHSYQVLRKHGYQVSDILQNIGGMNIYPMIFQGACQHTGTKRVTDQTFWIHHANMSWL